MNTNLLCKLTLGKITQLKNSRYFFKSSFVQFNKLEYEIQYV